MVHFKRHFTPRTAANVHKAYWFLAACAILAALFSKNFNPEWIWLHFFTKPTATALLIIPVLFRPTLSPSYRNAIALGLIFSVAGDFFLMLPQDYFLTGLSCFFLTHCAYIYAFLHVLITQNNAHKKSAPSFKAPRFNLKIFGSFTLIAFIVIIGMWQGIPATMRIPVILYTGILALMAALAVTCALETKKQTFFQRSISFSPQSPVLVYAAIGSIFFLISDSILAYARFRLHIPLASVWVLDSYYLAQWLIARSV